jgi:hypothetical protein
MEKEPLGTAWWLFCLAARHFAGNRDPAGTFYHYVYRNPVASEGRWMGRTGWCLSARHQSQSLPRQSEPGNWPTRGAPPRRGRKRGRSRTYLGKPLYRTVHCPLRLLARGDGRTWQDARCQHF